jgi:ketosteroid isomerase-like protein
MSRENVEIVRGVHDAVASGDAATVLAFYAPDVEWDVSRGALGALEGLGVYRGHEGLRSFFRTWREAWGEAEYVLGELIDAGEHDVITVGSQRATGRASGAQVEGTNQAAVWTIRDEKITRVVWFPTRHEALHAVGLRE